jgi:glycosyltransferase involved in cell wall biosynthesis
MPKEPVLSFYLPVYKKPPEVFEKCLESLFDMSFKDIEVICVFDGPDAELESVARRYPVQSQVIEHGGAPKARNVGFAMTKGSYVVAWDADCYAKPEMASMWMETFDRNPDAAFVYSGYEFANEMGSENSEQFDVYSLQCGNYIASMFPVKREFFPGWDESLKAGQDWDFWLSVVEKGGKGIFIQGYGWLTEPSLRGSISFDGWSPERRDETIRIVREKHGIKQREIGIYGTQHYMKALHIAKLLDADILKGSGPSIDKYNLLINLGYSPMIRMQGARKDAVRIQYWMPWDIDCLYGISHRSAVDTVENAKKEVTYHFCNEIVSKKRLSSKYIGIDAEIVPLPTEIDNLEGMLPPPDDFRVLIDVDKAYQPIVKDLEKDLPYIPIDTLAHAADITKYSMLVSFYEHPTVDEGMRRFLLNGRNLISNVQAPYCGYMDMEVGHPEFRKELFTRIRNARGLPFNKEAQDYYSQIVDPNKFKEKVLTLLPKTVMEGIS